MIKVKIPKSFSIPVTLSRVNGDGSYVDGLWVEAGETRKVISVSWQPIKESEYRLLPEGETPQGVYKVYWNGDFIYGIEGKRRSDQIIHNDKRYKLLTFNDWSHAGFTSAFFKEIK